jgi:hypothetical protein
MMSGYGPPLLLRAFCIATAAAIAFQLFCPGAQPIVVGLLQPPWDTAAHFLVYSALTALLWTATAGRVPLAVFATVIIVGGLDELHQRSVPSRVADAADFLADISAAACTSALMLMLDARKQGGRGAPPRPAGPHTGSQSTVAPRRRRRDARETVR